MKNYNHDEIQKLIGKKDTDGLIDALNLMLTQGPDRFHYWVLKGLGEIGDKRAIEPIINILENVDHMIISAVRTALNEISGLNLENNYNTEEWINWWYEQKGRNKKAEKEISYSSWYSAENKSKHLSQVVLNISNESKIVPKIKLITGGNRIQTTQPGGWASDLLYTSDNKPKIVVNANGAIDLLLEYMTTQYVAFAFYKLSSGGVFQIFNHVEAPKLEGKFGSPFIVESSYWMEDSDTQKIINDLFTNDIIEIYFVTKENNHPCQTKYGFKFKIDDNCRKELFKEFNSLNEYHQSIEVNKRNYQESLNQYNSENPIEEYPILKKLASDSNPQEKTKINDDSVNQKKSEEIGDKIGSGKDVDFDPANYDIEEDNKEFRDLFGIDQITNLNLLKYETIKGNNIRITGYKYPKGHYDGLLVKVNIPGEIDGKKVIEIGNESFRGKLNINAIVIPHGVEKIGYKAFAGCSNLQGVLIPNSVGFVETKAFTWCTNLIYVRIPYGVSIIKEKTFKYSGLTKITIPESVEKIERGAFGSCERLSRVEIPESVTSIEALAFFNCENVSIFCDTSSKPASWDNRWSDGDVYWNGIKEKKPFCYIATAVYGDYDAPQVIELRKYRDNYLLNHFWGKIFVSTYYRLSPPIANWMKEKKTISIFVKRLLDVFVKRLVKKHSNR